MNPILIDIPFPIKTERLLLRPSMPGDGAKVNQAILESFNELTAWLPWADHKPSIEETESSCRTSWGKWILRQDLSMIIFDIEEKNVLGGTGLHRFDWTVPKFEIGYWIRTDYTKKGIATEAAHALTQFAFKQLQAKKVSITSNENNAASCRVAEKLGFHKEGVLKNDRLAPHSHIPANTVIYARYDCKGLPPLNAIW